MLTFIFALLSFHVYAQTPELDGLWKQGCHVINDDDFVDMQIEIQNHQLAVRGYGFEDEKCKTPYIFYEEFYTLQSLATKSAHSAEFDANLVTKEISYTPLSDEVARALNEGTFCGLTGWKDHVKKVVTGESCNDENLKKKGSLYFQSLRLNNASSLSFGLTDRAYDGSSEAKRPQSYEPLPFLK